MESVSSIQCHATSKDSANCFDTRVKYFEFSGLDLLCSGNNDTDYDASDDSSYSSYCNDSLQLSGVRKRTKQQQRRRSSVDGAIQSQSVLTLNKIQRSASVTEMLSWLAAGEEDYDEDILDVESSICLKMTKPVPLKTVDGKGEFVRSFSGDILASQAVAGGAGRAA